MQNLIDRFRDWFKKWIDINLKIYELNKNSDYIIVVPDDMADDGLVALQQKFQSMVNGQVIVIAGASIDIIRIKDENTHKK